MSQLSRVAKVLRKHTRGSGITVSKLAKLAGVPKTTVYKRIADLRQEPGRVIYSNYRMVNGQRKLHYRIAA
jgi:DNA-binding Lrp family transcriptional regulator